MKKLIVPAHIHKILREGVKINRNYWEKGELGVNVGCIDEEGLEDKE